MNNMIVGWESIASSTINYPKVLACKIPNFKQSFLFVGLQYPNWNRQFRSFKTHWKINDENVPLQINPGRKKVALRVHSVHKKRILHCLKSVIKCIQCWENLLLSNANKTQRIVERDVTTRCIVPITSPTGMLRTVFCPSCHLDIRQTEKNAKSNELECININYRRSASMVRSDLLLTIENVGKKVKKEKQWDKHTKIKKKHFSLAKDQCFKFLVYHLLETEWVFWASKLQGSECFSCIFEDEFLHGLEQCAQKWSESNLNWKSNFLIVIDLVIIW